MTIPWPIENAEPTASKLKKGVAIKLFGVVFIFLGAMDSMMAWRGGFAVSLSFVALIGTGLLLYAVGAIRSRTSR